MARSPAGRGVFKGMCMRIAVIDIGLRPGAPPKLTCYKQRKNKRPGCTGSNCFHVS